MDRNTAVGYAEALLALARARKEENRIENSIRIVSQLFRQNAEFRAILKDHGIPPDDRIKQLRPLFGAVVDDLVIHHIHLMMQQAHETFIGAFIDYYLELTAESRESIPAEVFTAVPLDGEQLEKLEHALSGHVHRPVQIQNMIDESIMGGAYIRVGNEVIDHSVRTRLRHIRSALSRAAKEIEVNSGV